MHLFLTAMITVSSAFFFDYSVPQNRSLLQEWGAGNKSLLSMRHTYNLMTWNLYKGGMDGVYNDLEQFTRSYDFIVMQEFLLSTEQQDLIDTTHQYWALAKSFQDSGVWTGVALTSPWNPKSTVSLKSPGTEPFTNTPKMALVSTFDIEDGRQFMIVTVHALNFNLTHKDFKQHIDDVIAHIKFHKGPMILAGDFNTWAQERREYLIQKTQSIGLQRADLENPMGILHQTLDHIFYRELKNVNALVLNGVQTSDHLPMTLQFQL
ncbi:MAG: endonuclease/exonuclease/phosphatase family protein [Bdellovibrionaceae bacterium]|nr:endonuclease/exonuclease/phosphatase family protein [Pseudobdellovibrionaceae bacterium]